MHKIDCFGYNPAGCRVFENDGDFDCEGCTTYKTWADCYKQQKKCEKRLKKICQKFQFEYSIPKDILEELKRNDRK